MHPSVLVSDNTSLLVCNVNRHRIIRVTHHLSKNRRVHSLQSVHNAYCTITATSCVPIATLRYPTCRLITTPASDNGQRCTVSYHVRRRRRSPVQKGAIARHRNGHVIMRGPPSLPLAARRVSTMCNLPCVQSCRPDCRTTNNIPNVRRIGFSIVRGQNYVNTYGFYTLTCRRKHVVADHDRSSIIARIRTVAGTPSFGNCIRSINNPATGFQRPTYSGRQGTNTYGSGGYLTPAVYPTIGTSRDSCLGLLQQLQGVSKIGGIFVHSNVHCSCLLTSPSRRFFGRLMRRRIDNRLGITPRRISSGILNCVNGPSFSICRRFHAHFCRLAGDVNGGRFLIPCLVSSRPNDAITSTVGLTRFLGGRKLRPRRMRSFCPAPNAISAYVFCANLSPIALGPIFIPHARSRGTRRQTVLRCCGPRGRTTIHTTLHGTNHRSLVNRNPRYLMPPRGKITTGPGGGVNGGNGSGFDHCDHGGGGWKKPPCNHVKVF